MPTNNSHPVVCFGEVLWDILPTASLPGGAPMNVAYHLTKQGKNPALITKIGIDDKGKELLEVFNNKGVCTDYFQVDYDHETGKVFAEPNEHNEVVYNIVKPSAWDLINWDDELEKLVQQAEYFVFGSLAARSNVSKNTMFKLLEIASNKVLDINLRAPHYNRRIVEELLSKADFLKLNLAELELITGWFTNYTSVDDRMRSITDKFKISRMVVTMGGDGSILSINGNNYRSNGIKVEVVDTVGSGDAFLAGLIASFIENKSPEQALDFASAMGAFIATQPGACPDYTMEDLQHLFQNENNKSKTIS
jgi:fructokinase